jgi:hypothetical protein
MSIRISEGGRLFAIVAGLGGAVMIGSAGLSWREVVFVSSGSSRLEIGESNRADGPAMLVLGLFVIAGAACFIALRSRWKRMTAGALVVLAAAVGLVIALADPHSSAAAWGTWGAVLAAGFGIVALLRSGEEVNRTPAAGSPTVPSGATLSRDLALQKRRMSDAALLGLILVALVIALVVGFSVIIQQICSESGSWC